MIHEVDGLEPEEVKSICAREYGENHEIIPRLHSREHGVEDLCRNEPWAHFSFQHVDGSWRKDDKQVNSWVQDVVLSQGLSVEDASRIRQGELRGLDKDFVEFPLGDVHIRQDLIKVIKAMEEMIKEITNGRCQSDGCALHHSTEALEEERGQSNLSLDSRPRKSACKG